MSTQEINFKEIDGVKYKCEMMPGLLANSTLVQLTKLVGRPVLITLSNAVTVMLASDDKEAADVNFDVALGSLMKIGVDEMLSTLTPEQANYVLLSVMTGVTYDGCNVEKDLGDAATFSRHFRGRLFSSYKVWKWALEVNYKDFINAARSNPLAEMIKVAGLDVLSNMKTSIQSSAESSTTDNRESTSGTSTS